LADRRPAPETNSEVRGEDWGGREIRQETFTGVAFTEVDLSEVVTERSVFDQCHFRGVRFNVSTHTSTAFLNCRFTRCTFFDSTFTGCKLTGSVFDGCSTDLLKVVGGDWSFVGLSGAELGSASFTDVRMREADLGGIRAISGTLRGLDLSGASLSKANLTDCDLRGSDLSSLDPTVVLRGAVITFEQAVSLAVSQGLDVRGE
jgi:fluoroquinolone resistance protein